MMRAASELTRRSLLALGAVSSLSGCSYFTPDTNPGALRFMFWGSPEEKAAVEGVLADYGAQSGVDTIAEHTPGDYGTKMNALIAGEIEPDAGYLSEGMVMRYGEAGRISNVLDWRDDLPQLADLMPGVVHQWAPGQAVTQSAIEVMLLFFDSSVLAAEGVRPPTKIESAWDWDEFVDVADRLTVDGEGRHPSENGYNPDAVARYGISGFSGGNSMYNLMYSNGNPIFDEAGRRSLFSTEQGLQVIQQVYDLVHTHRVAPSPAQMEAIGGEAASQLTSGRVAMVAGGQWELPIFSESSIDYDVAVLPQHREPVVLTFSGANAVFARSERLEDAWALTAALADPDVNPLFSNGLWMPLQEYCYTDEDFIARWVSNPAYPPGYREACIDATNQAGEPLPSYSLRNWDFVSRQVDNVLSGLWTAEMTPREACRTIDEQLAEILQGRYEGAER